MITEKRQIKISKFLSLVLRHKPETIELTLDENGWANIEDLLKKMNKYGKRINLEMLDKVVTNNTKKRFAYNADKTKIRANQGHSIKIDLGYTSSQPPKILYHGTAEKYVKNIEKIGLVKKNRHHVHLSIDKTTALKVGQRHGKPVIFEIDAEAMSQAGYDFFVSDNGVWLTDSVPTNYLKNRKV